MSAEDVNGKIKVLEKKEFRKRHGYSPDRAEAVIFTVDLLRSRGLKKMMQNEVDTGKLDHVNHGAHLGRPLRAEDIFIMGGPRPYTADQYGGDVDASRSGRRVYMSTEEQQRESVDRFFDVAREIYRRNN